MLRRVDLPGPFEVTLPEVYQVEVSSACNFNCMMCPRRFFTRKDKKLYIGLDLVQKMVEEGDFQGSYFVELQMSGEPLLHPALRAIVELVKSTGVFVGLSTNGSFIREKINELLLLDYVTVSVDSISQYSSIRRGGGGGVVDLIKDIHYLIDTRQAVGSKTVIDLQVIELEGWEQEYRAVQELFKGCDVNFRSVEDCSLTHNQRVDEMPVKSMPCLNPWLSVSVQSNGNVTACCFSWGDDIVLGSLYERTLEEIWNGQEIKELRAEHSSGRYRPLCSRCYMRSPTLLHWEIFLNSIRKKGNNVI